MLPSYFDYIFLHLRQTVRFRPELSPKFFVNFRPEPGPNSVRTRPEKPGPTYNSGATKTTSEPPKRFSFAERYKALNKFCSTYNYQRVSYYLT